jgi:hypothetical protein
MESIHTLLIVSPQLCELYALDVVLKPFDLPLVHPEHRDQYVLIGELSDPEHRFGPLITIEKRKTRLSIRIPWESILAIIHGKSVNTVPIGFVVSARA